jgi:hypothetical protein
VGDDGVLPVAGCAVRPDEAHVDIWNLNTQDRLTPAEIDTLLAELGGLPQILRDATPPEKTAIYQALGPRLVYQPDDNAVVATADLGRVLVVSEGRVEPSPHAPLRGSTS